MKRPTVVFLNTARPSEWIDEKGKVHRSRRAYYEVGLHLPDRGEVVVFPVPVTPNAKERIAAIVEALE
jgi:hypothetical protein